MNDNWAIHVRRRWAGTILLVIAALLIVTCQALTSSWQQKRASMVRSWSQRGDADLAAAKPGDAVADYRNGLAYAHDDQTLLLRLAEALVAAAQPDEAESYLRSLHESSPGSGKINLLLAQLSARRSDVVDAVRYYRAAVLGDWPDPIPQRLSVRMELISYLIRNHRDAEARAELFAVTAEMPRSPEQRVEIADLFRSLGDYNSAIGIYRQVLARDRGNAALRYKLGDALLQNSEFRDAERELAQAASSATASQNANAQQELSVARSAVRLDPLARGLSVSEESARLSTVLQLVAKRIDSCTPAVPPDVADRSNLQAAMENASASALGSDPQNLVRAVAFAAKIEQRFQGCKGASPEDRAIALLSRESE